VEELEKGFYCMVPQVQGKLCWPKH